MNFRISDEIRLNRKEIIEGYLSRGFSPPGETSLLGSAVSKASEYLGLDRKTLMNWIDREVIAADSGFDNYVPNWDIFYESAQNKPIIEYSDLPKEDIEIDELLDHLTKRNKKRLENAASKNWQTIKINTSDPIVIAFVGDPHLDDNGCNLELLRRHAELMSQENVYAVNIGDVTNNWVGSLNRLYAEQDTSLKTAQKLIKWFMNDSGINWLFWITGNHDLWQNGAESIKLMNNKSILIEDWQARVKLKFLTGMEIPVWASHDFKGKSQFNKVHGAIKAARERRGAAILACGHTHDWAAYSEEHPDTGEIVHTLRARGYKFNDHYAIENGFPESKNGATVAVVIDPKAKNVNEAITPFVDLEKAIIFKNALTRR